MWDWDKKKCGKRSTQKKKEKKETRIFHLSERVFLRENTYNQYFQDKKGIKNFSKYS